MSTDRNVDRLKRRHTKTSTYQNINRPKRRQTETSTDQNVDRPKRRQTKPNQNVDISKLTSTDQKRWHTKRWQTETWTAQFSTLYSRIFVFIILGIHMYGWWDVLYISVPTTLWLLGVTLHISTSKIKSILGGTPGIISKVKDHFERLTIKTDVCTEVVQMCE